MLGRFLFWPIPTDFAPDGGISFARSPHVGMSPTGTNLLYFGQAKAMLEHCINGGDASVSVLRPLQQRVLDEKQELDLRIIRLDEFIEHSPVLSKVPSDGQACLKRQLDVMHEISAVLGERIANF